ncbi:type II toxin-antitoxin system HicB family antitoxin [Scytonema sp. UIC 10036]|uniref:type II toxin-antitoxin system HicB family antitoxin n=1 Tax=Scytonema sp. UIC 10036 TaxID=2304196 RepID=UPI0012DA032E|nr:type II toxin-antitoxin system HicB family antitoxin [Scytonema sp. UIC 10036]MUG93905.1 type II toxin-antitoxin system HicB family antitoxin [Scytonema sp. UIC 10036]
MERFSFPVTLTPDKDDGGFVVTFRDVPEAITQGDTVDEALSEAADCLEEAIAAYIANEKDIPVPSKLEREEKLVHLPLQMAMKAAVHIAIREAAITKSELARRMNIDEKEARRIVDPHYNTKLPKIEKALHALGRHVELRMF